MQLDTRISDAVVQLSRIDDHQDMDRCEYLCIFYFIITISPIGIAAVCKILGSVGSSVIIDLSYSRWTQGYELAYTHGLAYVRFDRIMRPFLNMFADFMRQKRANNVVMIFQNARDTLEAMKQLMAGYPFRALIMDASDKQSEDFVERLIRLRPASNYYAVFARGAAMNGIFERVSIIQGSTQTF